MITLKTRTKWIIIEINNIASGSIKNFSFKLPTNIVECKGVRFSANTLAQRTRNYVLGNISFFINNRREQPLQYVVISKPLALLKRKHKTLRLESCIAAGSFVQGIYVDSALASIYPYRVKIYLECTQFVS